LTISRPIALSVPSSLFITLLILILLVSSVIERHLNVCAFGPAYHNIASTSTSTTSSSGTAAASAIITTTTRIPSRISMMITTKDTNDGIDSSSNDDDDDDGNLQLNLNFRSATLEDIPRCFEIESASYPSDEAATVSSLTSRQKHAGMYFILCYTTTTTTNTNDAKTKKQQQKQKHDHEHDHEHEQETIIGFVCGTRCTEFNEQSMSKQHNPSGKLLAIHSVVVEEQYRRKGIASKMMTQYIRDVVMTQREEEGMQRREEENDTEQQQQQSSLLLSQPVVESIVLIAKEHLLGFYVRCGFCVNRPSPIIHGKDLWYDIEMELLPTTTATATATATAIIENKTEITNIPRILPRSDESWFCKTEQFSRPFPEVKPYLEEHKQWVQHLRETQDKCIVSGYRVDDKGKPGGGGLMFVAAKSYQEALELVSKYDPLIVNNCVDWELNGWVGQVGDISIR